MNHALTRVTLAFVPQRLNVYLRFGHPHQRQLINGRCRSAFFEPKRVFCRIWWEANAYGTVRWQLAVLQAMEPGQFVQRVAGVRSGASMLLQVEGERTVRAVLRLISTIESVRVDPVDVAPSYWRMVQNRLAARVEFGTYTPLRHAAHQLQEAST